MAGAPSRWIHQVESFCRCSERSDGSAISRAQATAASGLEVTIVSLKASITASFAVTGRLRFDPSDGSLRIDFSPIIHDLANEFPALIASVAQSESPLQRSARIVFRPTGRDPGLRKSSATGISEPRCPLGGGLRVGLRPAFGHFIQNLSAQAFLSQ